MIVDTRATIPGLGTNVDDVRCLVAQTLMALGVNMRADNGAPTMETIFEQGLMELAADMHRLSEGLKPEHNHEDVANAITRLEDRVHLLRECGVILAKVVAAERGGAP